MKKGQSNTSSVSASPSIVASSSTINNNVSAATANNDALFDRKIDLITEGIDPFFASKLMGLPKDNALTIVNYVLSMKNEINLSN